MLDRLERRDLQKLDAALGFDPTGDLKLAGFGHVHSLDILILCEGKHFAVGRFDESLALGRRLHVARTARESAGDDDTCVLTVRDGIGDFLHFSVVSLPSRCGAATGFSGFSV